MIDIRGQLSVSEDGLLWFNDDKGRCRLRLFKLSVDQMIRLKDGQVDIRL